MDRYFGLREGEEPRSGLRRVAAGRCSKAIEKLQDIDEGETATAVHDARKNIKKLRSTIRLLRDGIGDEAYHRENDRFRNVAGMLAGARDAEARLECIAALRERSGEEFPEDAVSTYVAELEAERDAAASVESLPTETARDWLVAGLLAIEDWEISGEGFELVGPGLERAYRRGRKRYEEAREEPSGVAVHEWRKRVKDLWYQLTIVSAWWPQVLGATAEEAHRLSTMLGDHHDLDILRDDAEERPHCFETDLERATLLQLIARRQDELWEEAVPLGDRLYTEKPARFLARIHSYYDDCAILPGPRARG